MDSTAFKRLQQIFEQAAAAPPARRPALLDAACAGDARLRAEVEKLLAHADDVSAEFLAPVSDAPGRLAATPSPSPVVELAAGTRIGRYTVVRPLAHGGMGVVYEARQERPARPVALKIMRPGMSAPSALARFRLEPEVLARLRHPNIALVYEAGLHEGPPAPSPYFAMELIPDALPLVQYAAERRLPLRDRLRLFLKVCDAVQHGHQKGIIHRDLKPANILVGGDGEPKIIDFGVARATDADIVMTTQCTRVGDLVGTVHYMSPEQCDGDSAAIDTRSDVYSLGVVLFELLTGQPPYESNGSTVYAAVRIIKESSPRQPSRLNRELRGDLDAILLKALEKDPARRYQSAADLARDIERHLAGEPICARPPGLSTRVAHWLVRHPLLVTGAACALILVITVAASTLVTWYTLRRPDHIVILPENKGAQLRTAAQNVLHTWPGIQGGVVEYAELIHLPESVGGGRIAILGFHAEDRSPLSGRFAFFDLARSLEVPILELRISDDDVPLKLRERARKSNEPSFAGESFGADSGMVADVFPDSPAHAIPEFIAVFRHASTTHSAICVYRLDGTLKYRMWIDCDIVDMHWLPGPKQLVCAGVNGEYYNEDRGVATPSDGGLNHLIVVFGFKLHEDHISTQYIAQEPEDREKAPPEGKPEWYRAVLLLDQSGFAGTPSGDMLSAPPRGFDERDTVLFCIGVDAMSGDEVDYDLPKANRTWIIDGEARWFNGPMADNYRLHGDREASPDWWYLPWDSWTLGELPPLKESVRRQRAAAHTASQAAASQPAPDPQP